MYVRQTHIASAETEREPFVIQPQQMQDCGVQVVDGKRVFHGKHTQLVRCSVDRATLDASTSQPDGEALAIVVTSSLHGFAFNVNPDLSRFDLIRPCGFEAERVTSIERLTAAGSPPPSLERLAGEIVEVFAEVFGMEPIQAEEADWATPIVPAEPIAGETAAR